MKTTAMWIQQADAALKRAAKQARKVAEQTGTALHVVKNGKIVKIMHTQDTGAVREGSSTYKAKKS